MSTAAIIFCVSTVAFISYAVLTSFETKNAQRVFAGRFRDALDSGIVNISRRCDYHVKHISTYVLKLGWYYGIHSVLRTMLATLVSVYSYLEKHFEHNRSRTKKLRHDLKRHMKKKTQLAVVADHKQQIALSTEEQAALKQRTLEQNH